MSRIWKKGFFYLTLGLSILFGYLVAKQTEFYKHLLKSMSDQTKDVMRLQYKSTSTEVYLWIEFLICFAVPFGLVWLLYFITMRLVVRDYKVSGWSLTRKMRSSNKGNV